MHPAHEAPAVDLELGLARARGADATGLLAERRAPAAQSRQAIAQQRQLDLGLALGGARVLGEDVEDHRGAVDGRAAEELLQVALLGRGSAPRRRRRCRRRAPAQRGDLGGLAPADERRRVGRVAALHDPAHDVGAGAVDQLGQLVELLVDQLGGPAGKDDADEDDPLPERALDERPG